MWSTSKFPVILEKKMKEILITCKATAVSESSNIRKIGISQKQHKTWTNRNWIFLDKAWDFLTSKKFILVGLKMVFTGLSDCKGFLRGNTFLSRVYKFTVKIKGSRKIVCFDRMDKVMRVFGIYPAQGNYRAVLIIGGFPIYFA